MLPLWAIIGCIIIRRGLIMHVAFKGFLTFCLVGRFRIVKLNGIFNL